MAESRVPSARERAVRTFFWTGAFFAVGLHLLFDVVLHGRAMPWWLLLTTAAVIGGLNAWSESRRPARYTLPDVIVWGLVVVLAVVAALVAEPAWWVVAGTYAVATGVIAVVDARRARQATASPEQVLHR